MAACCRWGNKPVGSVKAVTILHIVLPSALKKVCSGWKQLATIRGSRGSNHVDALPFKISCWTSSGSVTSDTVCSHTCAALAAENRDHRWMAVYVPRVKPVARGNVR